MKSKAEKSNNEKQGKAAKAAALQKGEGTNSLQMADNREVSLSQPGLQMMIVDSPRMTVQRRQMEHSFDNPVQRVQTPENKTGLPDELKTGIENLSGLSLDTVRVHGNSSKPAEVGAHAYTQGTNIYVAPGQMKHLPHEAWHVVQQMQGRVKPTMKLGSVTINDDQGLEEEAGGKAEKAMRMGNTAAVGHVGKIENVGNYRMKVMIGRFPVQVPEARTRERGKSQILGRSLIQGVFKGSIEYLGNEQLKKLLGERWGKEVTTDAIEECRKETKVHFNIEGLAQRLRLGTGMSLAAIKETYAREHVEPSDVYYRADGRALETIRAQGFYPVNPMTLDHARELGKALMTISDSQRAAYCDTWRANPFQAGGYMVSTDPTEECGGQVGTRPGDELWRQGYRYRAIWSIGVPPLHRIVGRASSLLADNRDVTKATVIGLRSRHEFTLLTGIPKEYISLYAAPIRGGG